MRVVHCSKCGQYISSAELRYIVGVHVTLDIDGLGGGEDTAYRLAERLASTPSADLADVFNREMVFTVCKSCRDAFVSNPLGRSSDDRCTDFGFVQ